MLLLAILLEVDLYLDKMLLFGVLLIWVGMRGILGGFVLEKGGRRGLLSEVRDRAFNMPGFCYEK